MFQTPDDPIVALATPLAASAIAVLRTSGAGSLQILARLVRGCDLAAAGGHTLHRCSIMDGADPVDEVLVSVFRAPRSYTGEDGAEISCHGSLPVIRRLLALLTRGGFRPAGPGEFTQRAFLNGKIDLTRAEAVNEIVRARTDRARALALDRLSGAVEARVRAARDALLDLRAALEVQLDYPDEDSGAALDPTAAQRAREILQGLIRSYGRGRIYQEGVSAAITGATNAGKSSLFNLMVKQERAIVSEIHGTTRDYLEASLEIRGVPVRLFDTAGLRPTTDPLEAEGIRRAGEVVEAADLVLYVVDSGVGVTVEDSRFLEGRAGVIPVWNKVDLTPGAPAPPGMLCVSSVTGQGLDGLEEAIGQMVFRGTSAETGEPLIDSVRQRGLLERALAALDRFINALDGGLPLDLLAVDLADALEALGEITGEVTTPDLLERMFSSFCVGK